MDVDMPDQSHLENDCDLRRNRIKVYKNILNYYRGRSLSLDFILASKYPSVNVIPEVTTPEALCKNIQGLHDDIILIQSIKKCLKLINCSLASIEIMSIDDINFRRPRILSCGCLTFFKIDFRMILRYLPHDLRDNINKIEGIIYFSKSIMKLYNECCSELDLMEKMKNYSSVLAAYEKSLHRLKDLEKSGTNENSKEIEKAELQIYKINLMRTMKSVLIGYISLNCPDLLKNVQQFKTPIRRDLTIDDFRDTWDVCL